MGYIDSVAAPENKEARPHDVGGGGVGDTTAKLSTAVFDSPQEFLHVLRDLHKEIKNRDGDYATRQDYFYAAQHAKDPKQRAAAEIAGKHFDDIAKIDLILKADKSERQDVISSRDIEYAFKFLSGNYKPTLYWQQTKNIAAAAFGVGAAAAMGTLTVLAAETPPLAIMFGFGTTSVVGVAALWSYEAYNYPGAMREKAQDTRIKLTSWPEINRHLGKSK